jgi:hypothetical protein
MAMLSFLRDQGSEDLAAQKLPRATGRAQSDMSEDAQGQKYLTVANRHKTVRRSTILVVVLFGAGLVGLWFMIRKSSPQTASAAPAPVEETQIADAIARLTGFSSEMFDRMDQIVKKFYEFSDVMQVQVGELVKNPFEIEMFLNSLKQQLDAEEQEPTIDAELIMLQRLRERSKDMRLSSIMESDQGKCCMINNRILSEGDTVKGFTVAKIGAGFVKLEWRPEQHGPLENQPQGLEIVLKLSQ